MAGKDDETPHDHGHHHEHGEACDHGEEEGEIVTLIDPNGNEVDHLWLGIIELEDEEGNPEQFALLTPVDELDQDEENTSVYVFHYSQDEDGAESFEAVEDEELLKRVQAAAEEMFNEEGEE